MIRDRQETAEIATARRQEAEREFRDHDVKDPLLAIAVFRARLIALCCTEAEIWQAIQDNTVAPIRANNVVMMRR